MDIDSFQKERLNRLHERYRDHNDPPKIDEVFSSPGVVATVGSPKVIVSSFNKEALLGLLPFSPVVYNVVCPGCFTRENFEKFKSLVTSGLGYSGVESAVFFILK